MDRVLEVERLACEFGGVQKKSLRRDVELDNLLRHAMERRRDDKHVTSEMEERCEGRHHRSGGRRRGEAGHYQRLDVSLRLALQQKLPGVVLGFQHLGINLRECSISDYLGTAFILSPYPIEG